MRTKAQQDDVMEEGAQAFAQTLRVPGGRTSFDFAVRAHAEWFTKALARGLSWNQIVELLLRAGVRRDDGRPLSRGHLSKVYSRQKAGLPVSIPVRAITASAPPPIANAKKQAPAAQPATIKHPAVGADRIVSRAAPENSDENARIKSFMARAANQRKYNGRER